METQIIQRRAQKEFFPFGCVTLISAPLVYILKLAALLCIGKRRQLIGPFDVNASLISRTPFSNGCPFTLNINSHSDYFSFRPRLDTIYLISSFLLHIRST